MKIRILSLAMALIAAATVAHAQVIPTTYRMTRVAPGQPNNTFTIAMTEMQCNLPRGPFTGPGFRINDTANDTVDCQYAGTGNWTSLPAGVAFQFALSGCNAQGQCGPSSLFDTGVPGAPGGFRLSPGFTGVDVAGTVRERYPFAGLDVARVWLDQGADLYLGAQRLSAQGHSVQPGDRVEVLIYPPK